jgi:hypothetical protein
LTGGGLATLGYAAGNKSKNNDEKVKSNSKMDIKDFKSRRALKNLSYSEKKFLRKAAQTKYIESLYKAEKTKSI